MTLKFVPAREAELRKDKERLTETATRLSCSVTALALAIDPTSTHGPETEKIVAYQFARNQLVGDFESRVFALCVTIKSGPCSCYNLNGGIVQDGDLSSLGPQRITCARCNALFEAECLLNVARHINGKMPVFHHEEAIDAAMDAQQGEWK